MSTGSKGKRPFKASSLLHSFRYAIAGVQTAVRNERNLKIHLFVATLVIILGLLVQLSMTEWLFVAFAIGGVISLELVNSALERVVDLASSGEYHPLAKEAKDIAAGAVFVYAILSVIVGVIIFLPKIM